ncbi:MAG: substrate-binding domain-containing protein [Firmicutes bacterium]|nr:substrate-binding domain-containing protein [Bacillota bacterium]
MKKNHLFKMFSFIILMLFLCFIPLSCAKQTAQQGGEKQPGAKLRIGVSLMNRQHDFYKDLEEGLKAEADKEGYELIVRDADFKLPKQVSDIEDFTVQKVDALIVCPVDSKGVEKAIQTANKANIPVFTADIASEGGKVECHIASDNVMGGRKAAEFIGKLLNGKGNIIILDWPYATSVLDRVKGFEEGIKAFPGIKIINKTDGGAQRDTAMKVMENMLQAHSDIDGVFAINDDTALGCLSAVEAAKRNNIIIVGYDAIPEAREAILRGSPLKGDVAQFPKEIGKKAIEAVGKYLKKEKIPALVPVEVTIMDKAYLEKEKASPGGK